MIMLLNHPVWLFVSLLVVLIFVLEIGFKVGRLTKANADEHLHEQVVGVRDAIVVLLSLLLAFTLAMAVPRFDHRKQLVVEEANALGTTSLRARMLPEPARSGMRELLRQYVNVRVELFQAGVSAEKMQAALARSKQLQNDLWQQTMEVAQQNPTPITALLVQSVNEAIDLDAKRVAAREDQIPRTIWVMLFAMSVMTCFAFGFTLRRRFFLSVTIAPLMISLAMGLIADLDTPHRGLITVSQESMTRLQSDLNPRPGGN